MPNRCNTEMAEKINELVLCINGINFPQPRLDTPVKVTEAQALGELFADAVMKAAHMTYNAPRGRKVVKACVERLRARVGELKEKRASPVYKKARYG